MHFILQTLVHKLGNYAPQIGGRVKKPKTKFSKHIVTYNQPNIERLLASLYLPHHQDE
jgi:hypothetical protein